MYPKKRFSTGRYWASSSGLNEGANRSLELVARVGGRHLAPDPGLALGHDRVGETDDVHALLEHARRHPAGKGGVADHHRHDGVVAGKDVEALLGHALAK